MEETDIIKEMILVHLLHMIPQEVKGADTCLTISDTAKRGIIGLISR